MRDLSNIVKWNAETKIQPITDELDWIILFDLRKFSLKELTQVTEGLKTKNGNINKKIAQQLVEKFNH